MVEVPDAVCPANGVLVRTAYSVISSGTETWSISSTDPLSATKLIGDSSKVRKALDLVGTVYRQEGLGGVKDYVASVRNPEVPLGYSSSGVVVEVGQSVRDVVVGDKVACAGEGKACHSELESVPRNLLVKVGEGISMKSAAFATIGAIAVHAVRTSDGRLGETVGVIGAGLVGNLVAQIVKAAGCRVVCIDLREDRLTLAKEVGADLTLRTDDPSLAAHVSHFTGGRGFDRVLVCAATSSSEPLNLAARLSGDRGTVVVVGRIGMEIERKDFYQKELKLLMSRSLGPGRYDPLYEEKGVDYPFEYVRWTLGRNMESFLNLVASGRVTTEPLVGGEFSLKDAPRAYGKLGSLDGVAAILSYPTETTLGRRASVQVSPPKGIAGKIGLAFVGPGGFAKETLMPLFRASPDFSMKWVVSSNPLHATEATKRYGFERGTCELKEALADPNVGLVAIATPNNLHYPMLAEALTAGKVAMVEKPLCISRGEFEAIKKLQADTGAPIIVGFNRRYSPLMLKMKEWIKSMDGPFFINYRVNAGFSERSKWSHDPAVGGGRIIHECGHFLDIFGFLLGNAEPEIFVQSAGVNGSSSVARDNLSITLKYPNGSLANLTYVAMGSKLMDRERIEVFAQSSSAVLEDFVRLTRYGQRSETIRLNSADKGHRAELGEVAKFLRREPSSLITTAEVYAATELTFRVDEAARKIGV